MTLPLPQHPGRRARGVRADRARARPHLHAAGRPSTRPAHVGNFRSFLFADLLRRYLAWKRLRGDLGHEHHRRRRQDHPRRGRRGHPHRRADRALHGRLPRRPRAALRITTPDVLPRATEHIDGDGRAHRDAARARATPTGPTTARSSSASPSWPAYGRLARLDPAQQRVGERVEADEYDKDDVRDFALWKGAKPGEPSWSTRDRRGPARLAHRVLGDEHEATSGRASTSTPAASTSSSRTTRTRSPSPRPPPASPSCAPGCTARTSRWAARRWPSGPATSRDRPTSTRTASPARALRYALLAAHYRAPLEFSDESLAHGRGGRRAALDAARPRSTPTARPRRRPVARCAPRRSAGPVRGRRSTTTSTSRRRWRPSSTWSASSIDAWSARPVDGRRRSGSGLLRDLDRVLGVAEEDLATSSRSWSSGSRPSGRPRGARLGARIDCATSSPSAASPSRTRPTASAGDAGGGRRCPAVSRGRTDPRNGIVAETGGRQVAADGPGRPGARTTTIGAGPNGGRSGDIARRRRPDRDRRGPTFAGYATIDAVVVDRPATPPGAHGPTASARGPARSRTPRASLGPARRTQDARPAPDRPRPSRRPDPDPPRPRADGAPPAGPSRPGERPPDWRRPGRSGGRPGDRRPRGRGPRSTGRPAPGGSTRRRRRPTRPVAARFGRAPRAAAGPRASRFAPGPPVTMHRHAFDSRSLLETATSSSPDDARSRRRSRHVANPGGCSSCPPGAPRSTRWSCTPRRCASRSSRSRAAR